MGVEAYAVRDVALREVNLLVASIEERDDFVRFMEAGAEEDARIPPESDLSERGCQRAG